MQDKIYDESYKKVSEDQLNSPPHTPPSYNLSITSNNTSSISYGVEGQDLIQEMAENFIKTFLGFWKGKVEDYGHFPKDLYHMEDGIMVSYIPVPWMKDGTFQLWRVGIVSAKFLNKQVKRTKLAHLNDVVPPIDPLKISETTFFIASQVEQCRSRFKQGCYRVVLQENYNTEQAFYGILGKGLRSFTISLQDKMKFIKPAAQELIEDDLDFANLLLRKANGGG